MVPIEVRRSADPEALARVRKAIMPLSPEFQIGWGCIFGVLQILQGVMALSRPGHFHGFAYAQIVIGFAFPVFVGLLFRQQWLPMLRADGRVLIDDAGLTIRPDDETIAWRRIANVRDVGEAFVFSRRMGRPIALFKADLPNDGHALWAELEARLVATAYLVRGTSSRTTITNTAVR